MIRSALALLPVAAAFALPAFLLAQEERSAWSALEDVHLDIIPRTDAERARIAAVTAMPTDFAGPWAFEENPGGAQTVRARQTTDAFSQPAANLSFEQRMTFSLGNGMFERVWVSAPASTLASDGLGPLYNARSCQRCHLKDGRGHPPEGPDDTAVSMFLRVSIPAPDAAEIERYIAGTHASAPEPTRTSLYHHAPSSSTTSKPTKPRKTASERFSCFSRTLRSRLRGVSICRLKSKSY